MSDASLASLPAASSTGSHSGSARSSLGGSPGVLSPAAAVAGAAATAASPSLGPGGGASPPSAASSVHGSHTSPPPPSGPPIAAHQPAATSSYPAATSAPSYPPPPQQQQQLSPPARYPLVPPALPPADEEYARIRSNVEAILKGKTTQTTAANRVAPGLGPAPTSSYQHGHQPQAPPASYPQPYAPPTSYTQPYTQPYPQPYAQPYTQPYYRQDIYPPAPSAPPLAPMAQPYPPPVAPPAAAAPAYIPPRIPSPPPPQLSSFEPSAPAVSRPAALSEPNSHAVLSSLQELQEKIHMLERQRTLANEKFSALEREAQRCKAELGHARDRSSGLAGGDRAGQAGPARYSAPRCPAELDDSLLGGVHLFLHEADTKAQSLEAQLASMRLELGGATHDSLAPAKANLRHVEKRREASPVRKPRPAPAPAPSRPCNCQSRHRCALCSAAETALESSTNMESEDSPPSDTEDDACTARRRQADVLEGLERANRLLGKKAAQERKGKRPTVRPSCPQHPSYARPTKSSKARSRDSDGSSSHYHLRFDDIPFVVGTSTGPSHSVGVNMQEVLSKLKGHHSATCGTRSSRPARRKPQTAPRRGQASTAPSTDMASLPRAALKTLLGNLRRERMHIWNKHDRVHAAVLGAQNSGDMRRAVELKEELHQLVHQLDDKDEQIRLVEGCLKSQAAAARAARQTSDRAGVDALRSLRKVQRALDH